MSAIIVEMQGRVEWDGGEGTSEIDSPRSGEGRKGRTYLSRGTSTHRAPTRAAARRALGMELRRAIRILPRGRLT